jgi:hypothetical protein
MRIGRHTNGTSCEYKMQNKLKEWLIAKDLKFIDELWVSEVSRRPDFLVWMVGYGLINIEAKCNAHDEMLLQLRDNAKYCDYSFAFIPDYCLTSKRFKDGLLRNNYGLIIYNYDLDIVTEVFEAHFNKGVDRGIRKLVIAKIDKELIKRAKSKQSDTQCKIEL